MGGGALGRSTDRLQDAARGSGGHPAWLCEFERGLCGELREKEARRGWVGEWRHSMDAASVDCKFARVVAGGSTMLHVVARCLVSSSSGISSSVTSSSKMSGLDLNIVEMARKLHDGESELLGYSAVKLHAQRSEVIDEASRICECSGSLFAVNTEW